MLARSPKPEAHDKVLDNNSDRVGIWKCWFVNVGLLMLMSGEIGEPGEKALGARERTNNKLNPHMTPGPGIEPGTQWWEASALTTAPSLFPHLFV